MSYVIDKIWTIPGDTGFYALTELTGVQTLTDKWQVSQYGGTEFEAECNLIEYIMSGKFYEEVETR